MFSTRDRRSGPAATFARRLVSAGAMLLAVMACVGCQSNKAPSDKGPLDKGPLTDQLHSWQYQPPAQTPPGAPMSIDEAMNMRDWPPSYAMVPDSSLVAYSTRAPFTRDTVDKYVNSNESADNYKYYPNAILQIGAYIGQTLALPFTYLVTPPFTHVRYYSMRMAPSYTGIAPNVGSGSTSVKGSASPGSGSGSPGASGVPASTPQGPAAVVLPVPTAGVAAPQGARPAAPATPAAPAPRATASPAAPPRIAARGSATRGTAPRTTVNPAAPVLRSTTVPADGPRGDALP